MLKEAQIGGGDDKFIKCVWSAVGVHTQRCQVGNLIYKVEPVLQNLSHQYKGN